MGLLYPPLSFSQLLIYMPYVFWEGSYFHCARLSKLHFKYYLEDDRSGKELLPGKFPLPSGSSWLVQGSSWNSMISCCFSSKALQLLDRTISVTLCCWQWCILIKHYSTSVTFLPLNVIYIYMSVHWTTFTQLSNFTLHELHRWSCWLNVSCC